MKDPTNLFSYITGLAAYGEKSPIISVFLCKIVSIDKDMKAHAYVYSENPHDAFLVPLLSTSAGKDSAFIDPPSTNSVGVFIQVGRRESFIVGVYDFFSKSGDLSNGMDRLLIKSGSSIRQSYDGSVSIKSSHGSRIDVTNHGTINSISAYQNSSDLLSERFSFPMSYQNKTYLCSTEITYFDCDVIKEYSYDEINPAAITSIMTSSDLAIEKSLEAINAVQNFRSIKNKKIEDINSMMNMELPVILNRNVLLVKETGLAFNSVPHSYSDILKLKAEDVSLSSSKVVSFRERIMHPTEQVLSIKTY